MNNKQKNKVFKNKSIMITGGTGYFGRSLINYLLANCSFKKIVVFSRDEQKHHLLKEKLKKHKKFKLIRFFIGDVRDKDRINFALKDIDILFHAAAIKHVNIAEENPMECIKTNIIGAENIVYSALNNKVQKVIALSTDKAANPINLYGATKLCSDKIFTSARLISGKAKTTFSVLRYGNVAGSTGSVLETFFKLKSSKKVFTVTDVKMTRFWLTIEKAIDFTVDICNQMKGGEIFVPKIPSITILDLVKSFDQKKYNIIGLRRGEKIHETMCPRDESSLIIEARDKFIIAPDYEFISNFKNKSYKKVNENFEYRSDNNPHFLNVKEIKILNNLYKSKFEIK